MKKSILQLLIDRWSLTKKIKNARENGYIFNQINNFKIKILSNLSHINIHYHLRLGASPLHRDYIETHCNDINNPFHFAYRQWYAYNNPGILT